MGKVVSDMNDRELLGKMDSHILVVEDSPTQAMQLKSILESHGYGCTVAGDGAAAVECIAQQRPTMVISDVLMPKMDGYELCAYIKGNDQLKDIPVILLTALSEPSDIIAGMNSGADNFLTKPYDEEAIISRIRYILINRELRGKLATGIGMQVVFAGRKHFLSVERLQILDLLLSSYDCAVQEHRKKEKANEELKIINKKLVEEIAQRRQAEEENKVLLADLQKSLAEVKKLSGLFPICASCKKIRDDHGYWQQIEAYIRDHSEAEFSHGLCPECAKKLYPEFLGKK